MLVAVMSDSHDNIWNLRKAVKIVRDRQAGLLVHCALTLDDKRHKIF